MFYLIIVVSNIISGELVFKEFSSFESCNKAINELVRMGGTKRKLSCVKK